MNIASATLQSSSLSLLSIPSHPFRRSDASCAPSFSFPPDRNLSGIRAVVSRNETSLSVCNSNRRGYHVLLGSWGPRQTLAAAVITTAVPSDCEQPSFLAQADNINGHEDENREDVPEFGDSDRMSRVCDKLIEVFMVDKPSTTDWRRLLAFSKEWNNMRLHFFKRCQERVDAEDDPGMKQRLLRLGRKLKEVDDDLQRHNELLEVIRGTPDISAVVARRRKDFTKEFFVHLHNVAESYYQNPEEQNACEQCHNDPPAKKANMF